MVLRVCSVSNGESDFVVGTNVGKGGFAEIPTQPLVQRHPPFPTFDFRLTVSRFCPIYFLRFTPLPFFHADSLCGLVLQIRKKSCLNALPTCQLIIFFAAVLQDDVGADDVGAFCILFGLIFHSNHTRR